MKVSIPTREEVLQVIRTVEKMLFCELYNKDNIECLRNIYSFLMASVCDRFYVHDATQTANRRPE